MHIDFEKRTIARTGIDVTVIGLGGAWLGYGEGRIDEDLGAETVVEALRLGINLIDTSGAYQNGRSEVSIGRGLREWLRQGGRREDVVLSTKTGTRAGARGYSADLTRAGVERSLEALGVDRLDIALVHDPSDIEDPLAPGRAVDELLAMKERGLIRAVGLGVRSHAFHRRFLETGKCDVCLTYGDYNLLDDSALQGVIIPAAERGVAVFNGMVTMYGLLAGGDPRILAAEREEAVKAGKARAPFDPAQIRRLTDAWSWAEEIGVGLLPFTVQYSTREARVTSTLLGAATPEQIRADAQAAVAPIPAGAWERLASLLAGTAGDAVEIQGAAPTVR